MKRDVGDLRVIMVVACLTGGLVEGCRPATDIVLHAADDKERCLPGGDFRMGSEEHYAEEKPLREAHVKSFCIDRYEVTNAQFADFVRATEYRTVAERGPDPKDYPNAPDEFFQPGSAIFVMPDSPSPMGAGRWWQFSPDAQWRKPAGAYSSIDDKASHPVVQLAFADALAYAQWRGRDLPTEAEWEFAARGGRDYATYAWGKERAPEGKEYANTWQGQFPLKNDAEDGYFGTAPVGRFPANDFGLYDMIGNVWEWTKDDFDAPDYVPAIESKQHVIKGGSYLCAPNYCARYRPAARQPQDTGLGTNHIGFRTVRRD